MCNIVAVERIKLGRLICVFTHFFFAFHFKEKKCNGVDLMVGKLCAAFYFLLVSWNSRRFRKHTIFKYIMNCRELNDFDRSIEIVALMFPDHISRSIRILIHVQLKIFIMNYVRSLNFVRKARFLLHICWLICAIWFNKAQN